MADTKQRTRWEWIGLLPLALLVRLPFLGRADLWCDEILFVWISSPPKSPSQVIKSQWDQLLVVPHLPLAEVIQNAFLWLCSLFLNNLDHNAFIQRLPAAILGALTVPCVYGLARRATSTPVALCAGILTCFCTFPFYYSREAYYYAPLILFSTGAMSCLLAIVDEHRLTRGRAAGFTLFVTGAVYTHISGMALWISVFLGLLGYVGVLEVRRWHSTARATPSPRDAAPHGRTAAREDGQASRPARRAGPAPAHPPSGAGDPPGGSGPLWGMSALMLIPFILVSPFIFKLTFGKVTTLMGKGFPVPRIPYDMLGKMFMGSLPWLNVPACILFVVGVAALWQGREHRAARRLAVAVLLVGMALLTYSAHKTQYSARYFSALLPLVLLTFAAAFHAIACGVARLAPSVARHTGTITVSLATAVAMAQLLIFLPPYYLVRAKVDNYPALARWLNENLQPGTPYLCESAYWNRFVSGFYPTPNLVAAAPYCHGAGSDEMKRLQAAQERFVRQFPEVYWIESGHGWDWAHSHFRRRFVLQNDEGKRIDALGIGMGAGIRATDRYFLIPIWYNTREDIEDIARQEGRAAVFTYEGWLCAPYARTPEGEVLYGRTLKANRGRVSLRNVTGQPVRGQVVVRGALIGPMQPVDVFLQILGRNAVQKLPGGQIWEMKGPVVDLPVGDSVFEWGVTGPQAPQVQALLVRESLFVQEADLTGK